MSIVLVTGATGKIGRVLVSELVSLRVRVRVLVRDLARAIHLPDEAVRVVGDLDVPATLVPAFENVSRVFLLTPGIGLDHTRHALAAAASGRVRHIVHVSSTNVLGSPMPAMGRWHHEREEMIRSCGVPATFLRPGGFMSNALDWRPTIQTGAYVLNPTGDGRFALIDPSDIAAVAASVLTTAGHDVSFPVKQTVRSETAPLMMTSAET